ncbi:MAG: translation termination inhibitor protein itt1 [Bathelium mastoideum]|nr:MAG: translation termination inhibitor protein itt1 [Bathelium mastoideum]
MAEDETDDERDTELESIKAIFEELQILPEDPYTAFLEIPVIPEAPLPIAFPAADGAPPNQLPTPPSSDHDSSTEKVEQPVAVPVPLEVHNISYLPPLQLQIKLPNGYPFNEAPQFTLGADPNWIPKQTLRNLELNGLHLWHEYGHGQVVFAFIDQLQQSAERAFGLAVDGPLSLSQDMRIALLDFDRRAARQKFEAETFDCGVCLEPKKGSVCHRMTRCGHVFCVSCLQDFYNNCITEGDISSVKCLSPECGADKPRGRKSKTLGPSQLLQIPLEHAVVKRYVDLKHKKKLESDKTTVYCPRKWCQGPARSKKYPKLTDFTTIDSSDEDSSDEGPPAPATQTSVPADRLAICSSCSYAFCRACTHSWHGDHVACPRRATDDPSAELTADDRASLDYIRLHTSPCPTCGVPCQKTHGCNHMRCFQCATHFCYLCSDWLSAENPYAHFNQRGRDCYMRLWELEEGDNGQGGGAFAGVRAAERDALAWEQEEAAEEVELGGVLWEDMAAALLPPPAPAPPQNADVPQVVAMMNQVQLQEQPQPQGARGRDRGRPRRGGGGGRGAGLRGGNAEQGQVRWDPDAQNRAIRRFLDMADADQEDEWDSDELDEGEDWEIPVR